MLEIRPLDLEGLVELRPPRFGDERGFFSEVWSQDALAEAGIDVRFVQDNHSCSAAACFAACISSRRPWPRTSWSGCRGAQYPMWQSISGGSLTFGRWACMILSAEIGTSCSSRGFAHGFMTLETGHEVIYKVSAPYAPSMSEHPFRRPGDRHRVAA